MNKKVYKPMHIIKKGEGKIGSGNWLLFSSEMYESILKAAEKWKEKLDGIDKPWLCWCVNDRWCIFQQKLIKAVGWTPVVGKDTNIDNPTILSGSVYLDFNEMLNYPHMRMQFPLEWVFLFCEKLAFWHSDLILSMKDMKRCAEIFEKLKDGETAAVKSRPSLFQFWNIPKSRRFFEVVGCTTRGASRSQYEHGCGWWRKIHKHPNFRASDFKTIPNYENGIGIRHWKEKYGGKVISLNVSLKGHAAANKTRDLKSKEEDLDTTYSLEKIAKKLGLEKFLNTHPVST